MINVAGLQLRTFIERIESVEDDIRDKNADKSEIYKELKSQGYDVKAVKKVVAARRLESHVREEQDAIFEAYWDACHGTSLVHARAHEENIEQFSHSSAETLPAADEESRTIQAPSDRPAPSYGQD